MSSIAWADKEIIFTDKLMADLSFNIKQKNRNEIASIIIEKYLRALVSEVVCSLGSWSSHLFADDQASPARMHISTNTMEIHAQHIAKPTYLLANK